jgi:hypothetical protein
MSKLGEWYARLFIKNGMAKKRKKKHGRRNKSNK